MLSVVEDNAPPPCPPAFNLTAHVLGAAEVDPDKIALAIVGPARAERWSFGRLKEAVLGTATGLLEAGLEPGDRLFLRLGNTVDFPILYLAAAAVDVLPVPISAQLAAPEVDALAAAVAPAMIVADPRLPMPAGDFRVLSVEATRDWRRRPPATIATGDPDRPGYVIFTSGTGGGPRAVLHAHRAVWARRMMHDGWYGLRATDRLLHAGAFNWTYTLGTGLLDPWTLGATALVPHEGVGHDALPLLLRRHDATIFAAAPGVYRQMLKGRDRLDLPRLRHGLSAGERLAETTRAAWERATGTPIYEALGMTECSTFISGSPARPAPPGATGYPQPGRRVAVLGSDGRPVPRGTPGTLAVDRRDPGLMLGYLDRPDETAARLVGDWFVTGDQVVMADDGAVTYLGRDDDMMNAGGFRVSPLEVEAALSTHPGIGDCAAVEVRVKADATVIAAFYEAEADLDAADLTAYLGVRLARYKTPRIFQRVDALPRGANGKVLRRKLREDYEARHGKT